MSGNGSTPAEIAAWVAQAWEDILLEFAGCLGESPDEETVVELRKLFDKTIKNAIENHDVAWEEPIRSYSLRHVCQIAKTTRKCACGQKRTAACLPETAEGIMEQAHKTCERLSKKESWTARGGKLGILCGRGSASIA